MLGHISCSYGTLVHAQVMAEVQGFLQFLGEVYNTFGLDYSMALSTRPEGYLGSLELWDKAEGALTDALNSTGRYAQSCIHICVCHIVHARSTVLSMMLTKPGSLCLSACPRATL